MLFKYYFAFWFYFFLILSPSNRGKMGPAAAGHARYIAEVFVWSCEA